jgi:hypothetical protein
MFSLNDLPNEIDEDFRFAVFDNSNSSNPDHFFIPLIFLESFTGPAVVLKIDEYEITMPLDWCTIVGDQDCRDMEVLPLTSLNDRGFKTFTFNPLSSYRPEFLDIDIVDVGGGVLQFNNISTLQTVTGRGATTTNVIFLTNTATSTSTTTGALIVSGGVGVGGRINSESLKIADTVFDSTVQTINSIAWTTIDEYSFNQFRTAKYLIQIDEGTTSTARSQVTELLTLATNSGTVYITEYGNIMPYGDLGNFDANIVNAGSDILVRLYFMATDTVPKTVKVLRTAMAK